MFHRTPPAPPAPPAVTVDSAVYVGSPLTGPTTAPVPGAAQTVAVDVEWIALAQFPGNELLPLDAQSSLTSAPLGSGPVLTVGQSTRLIRFGEGDLANQFSSRLQSGALGLTSHVIHQSGNMTAGTAVRFSCVLPHAANTANQEINLCIGRVNSSSTTQPTTSPLADGMMSVGVEGLSAIEAVKPISAGGVEQSVETRRRRAESKNPTTEMIAPAITGPEVAYVDHLKLEQSGHFALLIPCRIEHTPWTALAADITIKPVANDADGAEEVAQFQKELHDSVARLKAGVSIPPPGNAAELQSAIDAMSGSKNLRPPLLFLATTTNGKIAADFVLVADDGMLKRYSEALRAKLPGTPKPGGLNNLSWTLDQTAILLMTGMSAKGNLPTEMQSVLVLHAGEIGRQADSLEGIAKSVNNSADLQLRLIGENYISLEDSSPSARVRAFDWLKAQGKAPAGFDPLADRKSRRDALNKALALNGGAQ